MQCQPEGYATPRKLPKGIVSPCDVTKEWRVTFRYKEIGTEVVQTQPITNFQKSYGKLLTSIPETSHSSDISFFSREFTAHKTSKTGTSM